MNAWSAKRLLVRTSSARRAKPVNQAPANRILRSLHPALAWNTSGIGARGREGLDFLQSTQNKGLVHLHSAPGTARKPGASRRRSRYDGSFPARRIASQAVGCPKGTLFRHRQDRICLCDAKPAGYGRYGGTVLSAGRTLQRRQAVLRRTEIVLAAFRRLRKFSARDNFGISGTKH